MPGAAAKKPEDAAFQTKLVGHDAAMKGHDTLDAAEADIADRNKRAEEMGIKARYEVFVK